MYKRKPILSVTAVTLLFIARFTLSFAWPAASTAAATDVPQAVPYLVKNVEVYQVSWSPGPAATAQIDGILYFGGNTETHGFELWRSDGTEAGTYMIKDINPGAASSTPLEFVVLDNVLYFSADDGSHGYELWRSDGTAAGTYMVKDIHPDADSFIYGMTVFNGHLIFAADDGTHGYELWRSNGVETGTYMVKDVNPGSESSYPFTLAALSGALLLELYTPDTGYELWRTDGTEAGTFLVKDIHPGPNDASLQFDAVVMNNVAYFSASDGLNALWRSDGSETGTYLVSPAANTEAPFGFAVMGSNVFFGAYGAGIGAELWKTDGTLAGTSLVKDINNGPNSSVPSYLTAIGNTLFFRANNDVDGTELWQSDGTEAGTVMVKNIAAADGSSNPNGLTAAHGRLYFTAAENDFGEELWQSDGTEAGTIRLTDIHPGINHSHPRNLTAVGDRLFFAADNGVNAALWAVADPQTGPIYIVNTRSDADNGGCTLGHCSLREAINAANDQAGANTINFAQTAQGTISPATALPTITEDLNIGGPGPGYLILNGALVSNQSLLRVNSGHLMLSGLTFWQGGGNTTPVGGALLAQSEVTLNTVRFNENRANSGGALALYSGGVLYNVEFYGNTAVTADGGALVAYNGTVTMYNSRFSQNTAAQNGGAIYMQGNFLNIFTSEFGGNEASDGGAVYADVRPTIDRALFSENHAAADGGAIYANSAGIATLTNLLLVENTAVNHGNALYLGGSAPSLVHKMHHTTIAAPARQPGTAVYMAATGTLSVTNNIIANHTTGIARAAGALAEDYNLFHDNETDRVGFSAGVNSLTGNPLFVSAAHALFQLTPDSPAVDAGTMTGISWDYNDRPRPQGSAPDIGFDELAQTAVTGPGHYEIGNTGVAITVTQTGDLAQVQLVWVPLAHPGYDEDDEAGDPTGQNGYWTILGRNSNGQPAAGFNLTLTLPHDNHPQPSVCRWHGSAWDCGRHGFNASTVWRHNVTAFSDWAVGMHDTQVQHVYLPLLIRP